MMVEKTRLDRTYASISEIVGLLVELIEFNKTLNNRIGKLERDVLILLHDAARGS